MIDHRLGIAVSKPIAEQLQKYCKEREISLGSFLTAMITELNAAARDAAIASFKQKREGSRETKLKLKRLLEAELARLTDEEIEERLRNAAKDKK